MQATPLLACEGSGLGPEGEDEPDPGLDEGTGTLVERCLTVKDLLILVGKRVVEEAEDALAAAHDIPETMTDSSLYASVATGAVPSAPDMDWGFHEMARTSSTLLRRGCRDAQAAWHAASTRKLQRLFVVVFTWCPTWFCSVDRREAAAEEEKVWVLEFAWSGSTRVGWEVRVFDAKRMSTHRFPRHSFLSRACGRRNGDGEGSQSASPMCTCKDPEIL